MKRLWLILFVIPLFAQNPCKDEALLEIGQNILDEGLFVGVLKEKLSANDYLTFLEKMEKCLNTDLLPSKDNYIVQNHPCWHPEFLILKYIRDRDKLDVFSEEGKMYRRMLAECKESADSDWDALGGEEKYTGQPTKKTYNTYSKPAMSEYEKQMLEIEKEKLAIAKRQQLQDKIDRAKKQKKERNKAFFDALMGIAIDKTSDESGNQQSSNKRTCQYDGTKLVYTLDTKMDWSSGMKIVRLWKCEYLPKHEYWIVETEPPGLLKY